MKNQLERKYAETLVVSAAAMMVVACGGTGQIAPDEAARTSEALLGDSLPGITSADFATVRSNFAAVETISNGLGPIFNERACGNCHANGGMGGAGGNIERRFGRFDNNGTSFNPLANEGGSLRQLFSLGSFVNGPTHCTVPVETEPGDATVHNVGRMTTPLFGLGLVEALDDGFFFGLVAAEPAATRGVVNTSAIALANPDDLSQSVGSRRVNRYGLKAAVPVLTQFAADAYLNEMGITTQHCVRGTSITAFCTESAPNGIPQPPGCDDLAPLQSSNFQSQTGCPQNTDDGVGSCSGGTSKIQSDVANFATFMTFLAPPATDSNTSAHGKMLFTSTGCADCHVDSTVSGGALGFLANFRTPPFTAGIRAADGVLRRVPANFQFHPFSDFAAHDMGSLGDNIGINAGDSPTQARRMRTAPLWGIRFKGPLLHDGRTNDIATAIRAHDGQGAAAASAFKSLVSSDQQDLVTFVHSL